MQIDRYISSIDDFAPTGRVLLIYGARRVGKTTLLRNLLAKSTLKSKTVSGDDIRIQQVLGNQDFQLLAEFVSGYDLLVVDEAQNIPDIGKSLKILVDTQPDLKIIATGSSSFDLSQMVGEPLTGRKRTARLYPFSQGELLAHYNKFELREKLEEFLVYGSYPEVHLAADNRQRIEILNELVGSYLLKDILALERIKNPAVLLKLLQLLAFQVGSEVSVNELAVSLGINVRTVERYLDLLQKSFVVFKLGAFSRNPRKEITAKAKYYFYDNGIRNSIILMFNPLNLRQDSGALWENFVVAERLKYLSNNRIITQSYFWRNYQQKEVDYLEEVNGELSLFEFKLTKDTAPYPKDFAKDYEIKSFQVISRANYLDFVT
jgi:uncharacterized protein